MDNDSVKLTLNGEQSRLIFVDNIQNLDLFNKMFAVFAKDSHLLALAVFYAGMVSDLDNEQREEFRFLLTKYSLREMVDMGIKYYLEEVKE